MADSLYGARLQGIMVDVFIKPCTRLSNDVYNYRESLRASTIEGIRNSPRLDVHVFLFHKEKNNEGSLFIGISQVFY